MSRIHEALKKAEQERAAMHAAGHAAFPAEPVPEIETSAAPMAAPLPPEPEPAPAEQIWEETAAVATPAVPTPAETAATEPPMPKKAPVTTMPAPAPMSSAAPMAATLARDFTRFEELQRCCAHPKWQFDPRTNVFLNPELSPRGAEQFRTLRSRLYQLRGAQELRTILVTSAVPKEGKTWVATNLAQAIVRQHDRRVLIIDADLRISRLHLPLGAPVSPGLTDYLVGKADEASVIQHGADGNLCLIAAGKEVSNPTELLSNGRMKKLLDRVAPLFDWVILDSPPCLPVADACMLAGMCDGVLLVVRAGATRSETAQKASESLQGKNVIGVVLNGVDDEPAAYSSYYYNGQGNGTAKMNGSNGNGSLGLKGLDEGATAMRATPSKANPN